MSIFSGQRYNAEAAAAGVARTTAPANPQSRVRIMSVSPRCEASCAAFRNCERPVELEFQHHDFFGLTGTGLAAGRVNSASMVKSTSSLTPIVVPGAGTPKPMPKADRFRLPCAEKPMREPFGSYGLDA